jgi:hypothetical protein
MTMDDFEAAIARTLRGLEERLLTPEVRATRAELERLLHEQFVEIGASGRMWDRAAIVEALAAEGAQPASVVEEFALRMVAPDVALVTYRARRGEALSWRSSIWRWQGEQGWRMLFHQGTPAAH